MKINSRYDLLLRFCIGAVWMANGLWCKVLDGVPRHREIAQRILGDEAGRFFIGLIGVAECALGLWVWLGWRRRWSGWLQIAAVAAMNALEFWRAPDLLLWGRWNQLFALFFIIVVWWVHIRAPQEKKPALAAE
jgi:hypothetical protein